VTVDRGTLLGGRFRKNVTNQKERKRVTENFKESGRQEKKKKGRLLSIVRAKALANTAGAEQHEAKETAKTKRNDENGGDGNWDLPKRREMKRGKKVSYHCCQSAVRATKQRWHARTGKKLRNESRKRCQERETSIRYSLNLSTLLIIRCEKERSLVASLEVALSGLVSGVEEGKKKEGNND